MPQSDEDWDADNSSPGSSLVHQVMAAQSVDEKNGVLCDGIYDSFTAKYERKNNSKPASRSPKRHNRAMKRATKEKNMARRELRAARREGNDEGVVKEVATKFQTDKGSQ